MKTVMVASTKGGTAKTTSVLALAALWAVEHQRRVALWDGDPQGTLTRQLRRNVVRDPWTADPVPAGVPELEERAVLFRGGRSLGLAPAAEIRQFFGRPDWEPRLDADLAIIDTPPGGLLHILAAADVADLLLVPVDTTPLGLEGLLETLDLLKVIEPAVPTRVLLTRVVARRRITREISEFLDVRYPGLRLETGIPEDARVPDSHKARRPVTLDSPRERASEGYRVVAAQLLDVLAGVRRMERAVNTEALAARVSA
jgi:cellulose biosynthesis protein BcsQ